ncbi:IclR family transcriptional regulator [Streptomyces sp. NPDC003247]|uniref:IclR family transcriptional regulator n=1 Tax=Streptomyces sp. NPDC003247 TaxID=3364677 RepID=UPI0036C045F1
MTGQDAASSAVTSGHYRERNSTADRALDILNLFSDGRLSLSGQDVAKELGTARSTAYRYVQSLTAGGFLEEDPRGGFRLGPRILELSRLARRAYGLSEVALPVMDDLRDRTGETVLLTRRVGGNAICLERSEADHPARISYERGSVLPINAGASALVLLAWLPTEEAEKLLSREPLTRFTPNTPTDVKELSARLDRIREEGHCVSRGELDDNILGIAAPLRDAHGSVTAAISIAALERRVPAERLPDVLDMVRDAARRISETLQLADS